MSTRKKSKSTRRNTGGNRTVMPPPYAGVPSVASLERDMAVADLAMRVAARISPWSSRGF